MASPKPQVSSSAASSEELSEVQVLDSNEPLASASSLVVSCSAQVLDSGEPLVSTSDAVAGASGVAGPSGVAVQPDHEDERPSGSSGRRVTYMYFGGNEVSVIFQNCL